MIKVYVVIKEQSFNSYDTGKDCSEIKGVATTESELNKILENLVELNRYKEMADPKFVFGKDAIKGWEELRTVFDSFIYIRHIPINTFLND